MLRPVPYQEAKHYLYTVVIMPLKKLSIEISSVPTPFYSKQTGQRWYINLFEEPTARELRHNYERERARSNPNRVLMFGGENGRSWPIGFYDGKRQSVVLYEQPFKRLGVPRLLGQLEQVVSSYTPIATVTIERDGQEYARLARKMGVNTSEMQPI